MKKRFLISLLIISAMIFTSFSASAFFNADVNEDNEININDTLLLLKIITSKSDTDADFDVDNNGSVDVVDVLSLLRIVTASQQQSQLLTIVENGESEYGIYADDTACADLATELSAAIVNAYGVTVPVTDKLVYPCIRLCADDASHGANGYAIYTDKNGIVISAANTQALSYALGMFKTSIIDAQKATGKLTVDTSLALSRESDEAFTITEALTAGLNITLDHLELFKYGKRTIGEQKFSVSQGACTDGEYIYFLLRMSDDSNAIVVKTDFSGNELAVSVPLDLGHANDMTYDSKHDRLVIVHGSSSKNTANGNDNGRRLSFIDPQDLSLIHSAKNIIPSSFAAGAIAYDEGTDTYFISQGGAAFRTAKISEDFVVTGGINPGRASRETEQSSAYTAQGMGADEKYIYFPMSLKKTDNILVIYDMDANYITTLHIPTGMESESLFFHDGEMYVFYNSGGAVMGKAPFTAEFIG